LSRCRFLGWQTTEANHKTAKDELEIHIHVLKDTLRETFQRFWVDISEHCGIRYDGNKICRNYDQFLTSVRQMATEDDVKKLITCVYLSFDFLPNYRKDITNIVMRKHRLKLVDWDPPIDKAPSSPSGKSRRVKDCFEKLTTQVLTNQRKNLQNQASKTCGFSFTVQRPGDILNKDNEKNFRKKKTFYRWMVLGEKVKFIIICFFVLLI